MEVYMDDITVYGGSFEEFLINLETILHRCIEKNLLGKMPFFGQPGNYARTYYFQKRN